MASLPTSAEPRTQSRCPVISPTERSEKFPGNDKGLARSRYTLTLNIVFAENQMHSVIHNAL